MENLYQETTWLLSKKIEQLEDKALHSRNAKEQLLKQFSIQVPRLECDKNNVLTEVSDERVRAVDRLHGFSPGQTVYFVLHTIPIVGTIQVFDILLKQYPWNRNIYKYKNNLHLKLYASIPIIGNEVIIQKLKSKAAAILNDINAQLAESDRIIDNFNAQLKVEIETLLNKEITKREQKQETEEALKPCT